jgi:hypothetical protein
VESTPYGIQLQPSEAPIPIFEVGMNIAFCENNAQHSGSGTITRIITPGERGTAYRTLQRAFEPEMEVLYEVESKHFPNAALHTNGMEVNMIRDFHGGQNSVLLKTTMSTDMKTIVNRRFGIFRSSQLSS